MTVTNLDGDLIELEPLEEDLELPGYDLFTDIMASINNKTGNLFDIDPEAAEKSYNPFVVNTIFSSVDKFGKSDSLLYAAEMNACSANQPALPKRIQYGLYYYGLSKARRFLPFPKAEKIEDIELIMEYYGYTIKKAKQILDVLTDEQVEIIRGRMYTGEVKATKSRKKST